MCFLFSFPLFCRKLFTAVATFGVGVQAMFFSSYDIEGFEGQEHIFTHLQKDTRHWMDQNIYGINPSAAMPQPSNNIQATPDNGSETIRQGSQSIDKS
jgi:hypothetical protein